MIKLEKKIIQRSFCPANSPVPGKVFKSELRSVIKSGVFINVNNKAISVPF